MKRFLLYGHGGAYNHGAEAIVKVTIRIIREKYPDACVALTSHYPEQDREYHIDADHIFAPDCELWEKEKNADTVSEKLYFAQQMYQKALEFITAETICLSIGGDNYCYPNWHRWKVFQQKITEKHAKSVLWGCSVEPSAITADMIRVLGSHTDILVRESRTYEALKNLSPGTDVHLLPDPAFLLEPDGIELPVDFHTGKIIGINISPLVLRKENMPGILEINIRNLINYILAETDMKIALIPHVTMPMDNDYDTLLRIRLSIPEPLNDRVWLADAEFSASQLKYIISNCALLVCTRTHASIAAYSSAVPTLVIGYSVKSEGIARDLEMEEFLLDVHGVQSPFEILNRYKRLYKKKNELRGILRRKLPQQNLLSQCYSSYI